MAEDILMSSFQQVVDPFETLGTAFVNMLPEIAVAIIVLILGYFLSVFIGYVVRKILEKMGLDKKLKDAKLADSIGNVELSSLAGSIMKWYLFLWIIVEATRIVELQAISRMLDSFVSWLPDVLTALVIMILGLIVADVASNKLMKTKLRSVRLVSGITKAVILFFVVIIALKQISLDIAIVENTFMIMLGGLVLAFALAIGIGFGSAMKDEAKGMLKSFRKNL